ncbi:unnamed protein product [Auanema sp. JU1783]|nr:unnamed protein product [Auanema sp. JU1783]
MSRLMNQLVREAVKLVVLESEKGFRCEEKTYTSINSIDSYAVVNPNNLEKVHKFHICLLIMGRFLFATISLLSCCLISVNAISEDVLACLRQERSSVENPLSRIVTVTAQQPAYLHCRVPTGTTHMVAWTRASDQALLTAGHQSFTSDPRFQVSRKTDEDWMLILRRADQSDSGCYLCEVNTEPISTIYSVYLDVKEAPTMASVNSKKSTKLVANMAGNEVLLNCTVALGDSSEEDVVWTRDGKSINLNDTAKYVWKVKRATGVVVHTVRIRAATMDDDGDYACQNRDQRASQIVHVNRAEAQRSSQEGSRISFAAVISVLSLAYYSSL